MIKGEKTQIEDLLKLKIYCLMDYQTKVISNVFLGYDDKQAVADATKLLKRVIKNNFEELSSKNLLPTIANNVVVRLGYIKTYREDLDELPLVSDYCELTKCSPEDWKAYFDKLLNEDLEVDANAKA